MTAGCAARWRSLGEHKKKLGANALTCGGKAGGGSRAEAGHGRGALETLNGAEGGRFSDADWSLAGKDGELKMMNRCRCSQGLGKRNQRQWLAEQARVGASRRKRKSGVGHFAYAGGTKAASAQSVAHCGCGSWRLCRRSKTQAWSLAGRRRGHFCGAGNSRFFNAAGKGQKELVFSHVWASNDVWGFKDF